MFKNFFPLLQHPKIRTLVTVQSLLFCLMAAPQVAEAYLVKLTVPNLPVARQFSGIVLEDKLAKAERDSLTQQNTLLKNIMTSAQVRRFMVWSVYPASVRGRVFGGSGGDPVLNGTGGW